MSEEQQMILRMVAEGKVTPDEGARLLEAIGRKHTHRSRRRSVRNRDKWFDSSLSDDPFQAESDRSPRSMPVPEDTGLAIHGHVGAFVLIGTDESDLRVSGAPRGQYDLRHLDDWISVRSRRPVGTLTVHMPRTISRLTVKSHVGQILVQNLSNGLHDCDIRSHTGSITVDTETLAAGRLNIRSHVGSIDLSIPRESAADITAHCRLGRVDTDLPMDIAERKLGYLQGTLNGGGADVRLRSHFGRILVREKEAGQAP